MRKYGTHQLIATQNFKESIDYTELESAWEVYLTAYVELDRASYTQLPDFTN